MKQTVKPVRERIILDLCGGTGECELANIPMSARSKTRVRRLLSLQLASGLPEMISRVKVLALINKMKEEV